MNRKMGRQKTEESETLYYLFIFLTLGMEPRGCFTAELHPWGGGVYWRFDLVMLYH